jgi:hypothetical protein
MLRKMVLALVCLLMIGVGIVDAQSSPPGGGGVGGGGTNFKFGLTRLVRYHEKWDYDPADPGNIHDIIKYRWGLFNNNNNTVAITRTLSGLVPLGDPFSVPSSSYHQSTGFFPVTLNTYPELQKSCANEFSIEAVCGQTPPIASAPLGLTPCYSPLWNTYTENGVQIVRNIINFAVDINTDNAVFDRYTGENNYIGKVAFPHYWLIGEGAHNNLSAAIGLEYFDNSSNMPRIAKTYFDTEQKYELERSGAFIQTLSQEGYEFYGVSDGNMGINVAGLTFDRQPFEYVIPKDRARDGDDNSKIIDMRLALYIFENGAWVKVAVTPWLPVYVKFPDYYFYVL